MFSAHVTGTLQGVGFRAWTRHKSLRLGLSGHVRNLSDGSVEVVASGKQIALDQLLVLLESGPPGGVVTALTVEWLDVDMARAEAHSSQNPQNLKGISGFEIRF
jgi:acylphosphatase